MRIEIDQSIPVYEGYAAARARGLYNVEAEDGARFRLAVEIPTEDDSWSIGVVVGPSGSGKSSVGWALSNSFSKGQCWREWRGGRWPRDEPVIEYLTRSAGRFEKATAALAAVGLGSVPSWLRPHRVLSTGEAFRAEMAKLLLSDEDQVVLDEFTSVLDRQVAQVGAGAFAKAWRRKPGRRAILLTCHYDILSWVEPDWVIDTAEGLNQFAEDRAVVEAKPELEPDAHEFEGEVIARVEC